MIQVILTVVLTFLSIQEDLEVIESDDQCLKNFTWNVVKWDSDTVIVLNSKASECVVKSWDSSNLTHFSEHSRFYVHDIFLEDKLVFPCKVDIYLLECCD